MTDPSHRPPIELDVEGMTCAACVGRVERVLQRVPGVTDAMVNLATRRASVATDAAVPTDALVQAIERAGYHASPRRDDDAPREDTESAAAWRRLAVSAALTAPLMLEMIPGALRPAWRTSVTHENPHAAHGSDRGASYTITRW